MIQLPFSCFILLGNAWTKVWVTQSSCSTQVEYEDGCWIDPNIDPNTVAFDGSSLSYKLLPSGKLVTWRARRAISA